LNEELSCFKAYDVRGELGVNLDRDICYRIGYAFGKVLKLKKCIIGWDARESSPELAESASRGLRDAGVNVMTLGLCGTEEMYFAVSHFMADGGIQITASHNPINYNGLKIVKSGSRPLDPETDLLEIKNYAENLDESTQSSQGSIKSISKVSRKAYVRKITSLVNVSSFYKMKVVVNSGNGAAGPTFDAIEETLKNNQSIIDFIKVSHKPDSSFPNGIPNPMLAENQKYTSEAVIRESADLGIAFDGDFDRCFFFDEHGKFVQGEYVIGLLVEVFLEKQREGIIVHDPRALWNIQETIEANGGQSVISKTGHAFIKQKMRETNAIYGAELSAHHYFRDFFYCDSGMLPWLLICELLGRSGKSLSELTRRRILMFPSSSECNFSVNNSNKIMKGISKFYRKESINTDYLDGISMEMKDWRFNLRSSNTENILRLNVESRGDQSLLRSKLVEISEMINRLES
jgi:phosphomannomutase